MKPVAKVARNGHYIRANFNRTGIDLPAGTELYTADQLRAAKVAVLIEAASRAFCDADRYMLYGMADEIEMGE